MFQRSRLTTALKRIEQTVNAQFSTLLTILERIEDMSVQLDALEAEVTRNTDVEASAVTLIKGIAQQLKDAGTDPTKLEELRAKLASSADALANAVIENTPAAPEE